MNRIGTPGGFVQSPLVSAAVEDARVFHQELDALRKSHRKKEYKWKDINKKHGIALADFFFDRSDRIRIDVLTWDMEDSRHHHIFRRDDTANFARMYFHLLHGTLKRRWPIGARWLICPDGQKAVEWETLGKCLDWKSWVKARQLFAKVLGCHDFDRYYNIHAIRCGCSKDYLLIQLADTFAGLAAYSYSAFEKYQQWKDDQNPTSSLFDRPDLGIKQLPISNSDKERLPILHHIRQQAGKHKLNVSLDSNGGLLTKNPSNPLNFWLYSPQRSDDKAPTKKRK